MQKSRSQNFRCISTLNELKIINNNVQEIKFVSPQLRYLLSKKDKSNCVDHRDFQEIDCDKSIKRNFWGFVKQVFQKQNSILPTFSRAHCLEYCKTSFSVISPNKSFHIPAWIPHFSPTPHHLIWMLLHINKSLTLLTK